MSRYNPAQARLFGGVQAPPSTTREALRRTCAVELVRHADVRARFKIDDAAKLELHPVVGERLECAQHWHDGSTELAVEVYAVHPGGFVDVTGLVIDAGDPPARITLRRYPNERNRQMASEQAEKIEAARKAYVAAMGTEMESVRKTELEQVVTASKSQARRGEPGRQAGGKIIR